MPNAANIRQAFERTITVFGDRMARGLTEEMATNGVNLDDPYLSFDQIAFGLEKIMGLETSELIIQRVIIKLDEMYKAKMLSKVHGVVSQS